MVLRAQLALATLVPFKGTKKSRFLGPPPLPIIFFLLIGQYGYLFVTADLVEMDVVSVWIAPLDELLAMLQPHDVGEHPVGNALQNDNKICMMSRSKHVHSTSKSQCCRSGSGSTGSTCFWASRIRIH